MVAALIQTAKKKEDSFVTAAPLLKFIGMLGILLTFLVFNIMLAGNRAPQLNRRVGSLAFHVVLPIMYIAHWFLFYERRKCKWYYPLASISFPLAYLIFIFIQAAIMGFDTSVLIPGTTTPLIYPYSFDFYFVCFNICLHKNKAFNKISILLFFIINFHKKLEVATKILYNNYTY